MTALLSTKAKRRAMAFHGSTIATDVMGIEVELTPCRLHPGEYHWQIEDIETERGRVSHVVLDVSSRGVSVHTRFSAPCLVPEYKPLGTKWNHYLWPHCEDDAATYKAWVTEELRRILKEVQPNGRIRCNLPDMSAQWAIWREEFAAECAARN